MSGQFWKDLNDDLKDPDFARAYAAESVRIATIDALVRELDELRESAGLSKAQLARAIGSDPSVVRRMFSSASVNPTVGTLTEIAAALGMRVALVPMSAEDQEQITEPMRSAVA
ncbi:XRE family transcriptional regulator [Microbacterium protaetiae]|uniref:XRE family transcriptional regulator n=1 Tax=Microbacterium protaetiae TaxID=2509458 RepID=A0A4P6EME7_9MICO|nr:helix-turn-helix transcriptional regulator [Microbacterium protaetiae]QAY59018.1 XRE family transcriptional regulator [Microbacterium protaetiae]